MNFDKVLGHEYLKHYLKTTADTGRIPHAQLFVGQPGSGALPMALAYARYVLCSDDDKACQLKCDNFAHPDLHFVYPTVTTDTIKSSPKSTDFLMQWREFLNDNPYATLFDWYKKLNGLSKNGEIRVADAEDMLKKLALKPYENGYRILIIWQADQMNTTVANKMLKLIEEPHDKTLIILVTEHEDDIIQTIKSRCQVLHLSALSQVTIVEALIRDYQVDENQAKIIAHQANSNYTKALEIVTKQEQYPFDQWFVDWVRTAFKAKGNPNSIINLLKWSETVGTQPKEVQKQFLNYCSELFRQSLLMNYNAQELVYIQPQVEGFELRKFAPFVNQSNIFGIFKEISQALYHLESNGSPKMIFSDLSIKLTRLIHQK